MKNITEKLNEILNGSRKVLKNEEKEGKNRKINKGISLMILVITIIVILILASTIIMTTINGLPINKAQRTSIQSDYSTIRDKYLEEYNNILFEHGGRPNDITSEQLQNIIPEEFRDKLVATKDGISYVGDDDTEKEVAKELGFMIGRPESNVRFEYVELTSNVNDITVEVGIRSNIIGVKEYEYFISTDGKNWTSKKSTENTCKFDGLEDFTEYFVKVVVTDNNGKTVESETYSIKTKMAEFEADELRFTKGSISGEAYEEGTWSTEDIYVVIVKGEDTNTTYKATGANTVNDTKDTSILTTSGVTNLTVTTVKYGKYEKTREYVVYIDKGMPEVKELTKDTNAPVKEKVVLTGKAVDNISGIVAYQFSKDENITASSSGWNVVENTKQEMMQIYEAKENGKWYFYVKDEAGNVSRKEIEVNNIDNTVPTDAAPTVTSTTNTVTVKVNQTDESGIAKKEVAIRKKDGTWSDWKEITGDSYTFENLDKNTEYEVKTKVTDSAGNANESKTASVKTVELTKPSITAPTEITVGPVIVTITYPDIAGTTRWYSTNGTDWIKTTNTLQEVSVSENNTTVYAKITDSTNQTSGNATWQVTNIDSVKPTLQSVNVTSPQTGTYGAGQEVTIVATYSEKVKGTVPTLKIKFANLGEATITSGTITNNTITYKYTIKGSDYGKLSLVSYAGKISDIPGNEQTISYTGTLGGNSITASTQSVLAESTNFRDTIPSNTTAIVFVDDVAPSGVTTTDVSAAKNGSVVAWLDGTTYKVSSQKENVQVIASANCSKLFGWSSSEGSFDKRPKITSIDLTNLNINNVTDMSYLFSYLELTNLVFPENFNTSKVTTMYGMFRWNKLTSFDHIVANTGFITDNVKEMSYMFEACTNLVSLDLSKWNTNNVTLMYQMFYECVKLSNLKLSENFVGSQTTNINQMFYECNSLLNLNVENWNTENVTTMYSVFGRCYKLSNIDVSKWNTENVTNMSYLFLECRKFTDLNVSNFNTSKVTNMKGMFEGCELLTELDVSGFDTGKVESLAYMFSNCINLTSIDVSNFNTEKSTEMHYMFQGCKKLTSIDLSKFNTSNVTKMYRMFYNCSDLKSLDLSNFDTSKIENKIEMFYNCNKLEQIKLGSKFNFHGEITGTVAAVENVTGNDYLPVPSNTYIPGANGNWYNVAGIAFVASAVPSNKADTYTAIPPESILKVWTENSTSDFHAESYRTKITKVKFANKINVPTGATSWDVSNTGNGSVMAYVESDGANGYVLTIAGYGKVYANETSDYLFNNFTALKSIENMNLFDVTRAVSLRYMFGECKSLTSLDLSNFTTTSATNMGAIFSGCSSLTSLNISKLNTSKVTNFNAMFMNCSGLTSLDVSTLNTTSATNMGRMFSGCSKLTSLDVTKFNTSKVTNMNNMFCNCSGLTKLDVTKFDTSKVTNMSHMFDNCSKLANLDVSGFDTSSSTNMTKMFANCSSLESLNVSNFNTAKVTTLLEMFHGCSKLTSLDVSKWDTSLVTSMAGVFGECASLTNLNVSKFDTSKVTDMSYMFNGCTNLTSLDVANFDVSNVTTIVGMFNDCRNITTFDVSKWNTSSLTTTRKAFRECRILTNLDVSNWNTSKVTNMADMFFNCFELTTLDLSKWNMASVTSKGGMFDGCNKLQTIKLSDTFKFFGESENSEGELVTDYLPKPTSYYIPGATGMWYNAAGVGYAPSVVPSNKADTYTVFPPESVLKAWTSDASTDFHAEEYRTKITKVKFANQINVPAGVTSWDVSNTGNGSVMAYVESDGANGYVLTIAGNGKIYANSNSNDLFWGFTGLKTIENMKWFDTSKATSMWRTFYYCSSLTSLDLSNFNTSNVTNMQSMFNGCSSLTSLDVSGFDTSKTTNVGQMFKLCSSLSSIDLSSWDASEFTITQYMFENCNNLEKVTLGDIDTSNVTDMRGMFTECKKLINLDAHNLKTNKVMDMRAMFNNCSSLASLDLSKWDTRQVENMKNMFAGCKALTNLEVSNFNTEKVKDMNSMFNDCRNLTSLDLSKWNTSNVTNMQTMFNCCDNLTNLNVSNFNTSNVTTMFGMFSECRKLTTLDVSKFNTSKVTNMAAMFYQCNNLETLDITSFDTSKVTDMSNMFCGVHKLKYLDLSNFSVESVTKMDEMFRNDGSLTTEIMIDNPDITSYDQMFENSAHGSTTEIVLDYTTETESLVDAMVATKLYDYCNVHKKDKVKPTDNAPTLASNSNSVSVTFKQTDNIGIVESTIAYSIKKSSDSTWGAWVNAGSTTYTFYDLEANTSYDVRTKASDKAKNETVSKTATIKTLELSKPSITASTTATVGPVIVTITYPDIVGTTRWYSLDGTNWTKTTNKVEEVSVTVNNTTVYAKITDSNNQTSGNVTYQVTCIDSVKPTLSSVNVTSPASGTYSAGQEITIVATYSENIKGTVPTLKIKFVNLGEATITSGTISGKTITYKYTIKGSDYGKLSLVSYTGKISDIPGNEQTISYTGALGGNSITVSTESVLAESTNFRDTIPSNTTAIVFVDDVAPSGVTTTDVSAAKNGSVVAWLDGTTYKVSSQKENVQVIASANCKKLFGYSESDAGYAKRAPITSIDLTNLNINNVTDMSYLFSYYELTNLVFPENFNTSKVTTMYGTFRHNKLASLDHIVANPGFITDNVTNMRSIFNACDNLTSIDLSNFNTSKVTTMHQMFYDCSKLTSLNLSNFVTSNVTEMGYMFNNCNNLTSIDLSNFDTAKVTNMINMFNKCSKLTTLDVSGFNTSNVKNMNYMFAGCKSIISLDVSGWNTSKVNTMEKMFASCQALTSLNLNNFVTTNVTNMYALFQYCYELSEVDVSGFNTSNVTTMGYMFDSCGKLTSIDVSKFNTTKVTHMGYMFRGCSGLTSIDVSKFNTANVEKMYYMFSNCTNLKKLDLSNFDTSKVASKINMFESCVRLEEVSLSDKFKFLGTMTTKIGEDDVTGSDYLPVPDNTYISGVTGKWYNIAGVGYTPQTVPSNSTDTYTVFPPESILKAWNSSSTTDFHAEEYRTKITKVKFANQINVPAGVTSWDVSSSGNGSVMAYVESDGASGYVLTIAGNDKIYANENSNYLFNNFTALTSIENIGLLDTSRTTRMHRMFSNCTSLTSLDVSGFDTSKVYEMGYMFSGNTSLTSLDVSNFNVSNVSNFECMFNDCSKLTTLNVSSWNTSKATTMTSMFQKCGSLTSLNVSNFKTSNVTSMKGLFYGCKKLTTIDVSKWDLSKVTTIREIFWDCNSVTALDVSAWNITNVTDMYGAFYHCKNITSLDVSKWNTTNTTNMGHLFESCVKVPKFDTSKWNTEKVTSMHYMFFDCDGIINLDLSNFVTPKLTATYYMFGYNSELQKLDISNLDMTNVTNSIGMFYSNPKLQEIKVGSKFKFIGTMTGKVSGAEQTGNDYFPAPNNTYISGADGKWYNTAGVGYVPSAVPNNVADTYYAVSPEAIGKPVISASINPAPEVDVTITYPAGEGLIYEYSTNGTTWNTSSSTIKEIVVTQNNTTIYARIKKTNGQIGQTVTHTVTNIDAVVPTFSGISITSPSTGTYAAPQVVTFVATYSENISGTVPTLKIKFGSGSAKTVSGTISGNKVTYSYTITYVDEGKISLVSYSGGRLADAAGNTVTLPSSVTLGGNVITAHTDPILAESTNFRDTIPSTTTAIVFVDDAAPSGVTTTDVSKAKNGSVVGWLDGTTYKVSSQKSNVQVIASANCRKLFGWSNGDAGFTSRPAITSIDLSNLNINNVTDMYRIFAYHKLTNLVFPENFNTSKVTTMYAMFEENQLTSLDHIITNPGFITKNVTSMTYMFRNCNKLTSIDVSNFNTSKVASMGEMFKLCTGITSLDLSNFDTSKVNSMYAMFENMSNLASLDVSSFNTSKVTNMDYMFHSVRKLTTLDVSNFNTGSVTTMKFMFSGCEALTSLDLSNFDTTNVKILGYMFQNCINLKSVDVSSFNTSNCEEMHFMFTRCHSLNSIDVSNFDTSNVKRMHYMFNNCYNLTSLDLSNFDTSKVKSKLAMFMGCTKLQELKLGSKFNFLGEHTTVVEDKDVTDTDYFPTPKSTYIPGANGKWYNTAGVGYAPSEVPSNVADTYIAIPPESVLKSWTNNSTTDFHAEEYKTKITKVKFANQINVPAGVTSWDVSNTGNGSVMAYVESDGASGYVLTISGNGKIYANSNSAYLFWGFTGLKTIENINLFDVSRATTLYGMFRDCTSLQSIDVSKWDTSNVTNMQGVFYNCISLTTLDVSNFNTSKVTNMSHMFGGASNVGTMNLETLDVSKWDTSNVTKMNSMFTSCYKLTSIPVDNWDTRNVEDMNRMFYGCSSLTSLNVGNFNTAKVASMLGMFYNCFSLETLNVANWNTGNVTDMTAIFSAATGEMKLKNLDVSKFNTANVTSMQTMFQNCSSLENINLSSWNTSKVTDMENMFMNCKKITKLDLSSFDTSSVTNMNNMFEGTKILQEVKLGTKFSFKGNGTITTDTQYLLVPSSEYITGADGKWYTATGVGYAPSEIPNNKADTYYAISPESIVKPVLTSSATPAKEVVVTITYPSDSGLTYEYSLNGTTWTQTQNTTQTVTVTTNNTTVYARVKKANGQIGNAATYTVTNIDTTAPTLSSLAVTSPASGTYKAGQVVTIVATYSENITGTAPVLKIKFGSGSERTISTGTISGNQITYKYTMVNTDEGTLVTTGYSGTISDIAGNTLNVSNKTISGNTITASNTYTVTYDGNGSGVSNVPAAQTKTHGVNLTISTTIPSRTGYTFKGWSSVSNAATSADIQPGDTYSTNKNLTLWAVWEGGIQNIAPGSYISYNGNGYTSWRVLHNNNGQIDIVSADSTEDVTLTQTYSGSVSGGYLSCVQDLNAVAQKYITGLATKARSLGCSYDTSVSPPTVSISSSMTGSGVDFNSHPYTDTAHLTDQTQIYTYGMHASKTVWLASRDGTETNTSAMLWVGTVKVRYLQTDGFASSSATGTNSGWSKSTTHGFRPVVSFPSGLKISSGSGTAASPYVLTK